MAIKLGRTTLTESLGVGGSGRDDIVQPVSESGRIVGYEINGRERGTVAVPAYAQTTMTALEKDLLRFGHLYCASDAALFPAGYYYVEGGYDKPGGRPKVRPWRASLRRTSSPIVTRQAEDDNVAGADTTETIRSAEEGVVVVQTVTTTETIVLQPRTVSGAEPFNLPSGVYRVSALFSIVPDSGALVRARTTNLAGTTLVEGSQVSPNGIGQEVDLGTFTVASADHEANWYEVTLDRGVGSSSARLDRVQWVPV